MCVRRLRVAIPILVLFATTALSLSAREVTIEPFDFDDSVEYNVVYQLSDDEIETVKSVTLLGLQEAGGRMFLVIQGTSFAGKKQGFILLDTVRSILPVAVERERHPKREHHHHYNSGQR